MNNENILILNRISNANNYNLIFEIINILQDIVNNSNSQSNIDNIIN